MGIETGGDYEDENEGSALGGAESADESIQEPIETRHGKISVADLRKILAGEDPSPIGKIWLATRGIILAIEAAGREARAGVEIITEKDLDLRAEDALRNYQEQRANVELWRGVLRGEKPLNTQVVNELLASIPALGLNDVNAILAVLMEWDPTVWDPQTRKRLQQLLQELQAAARILWQKAEMKGELFPPKDPGH